MKRDQNINLRLSSGEKTLIDERAESQGMKTSEFLRSLGLEGELPVFKPLDPERVAAQEERTAEIEKQNPGPAPDSTSQWSGRVTDDPDKPPPIPTRKDHLDWLVKRITELHRDKERRWPGVKARRQADREWSRYKQTGEQPAPIEPRDEFKATP